MARCNPSIASLDAAVIGSRRSGVGIRPLRVQHAFEHRRVRLCEPRGRHAGERLVVPATLVDLPGERALDHGDEPLGADVRRRADRARATEQHQREQEGILPTEDREVGRRAREQRHRVGVERRRLLDPGDVLGPRELEQAVVCEQATRARRDVVDDDGDRRSTCDLGEVRHDPGLARAHVVRDDAHRCSDAREITELLDRGGRGRGVVRTAADDELRTTRDAHTGAHVEHGSLLVRVEARRLTGRAERDETRASGVEILVREALDRVECHAAVGRERRHEGDVDPPQRHGAAHDPKGSVRGTCRTSG